MTLAFTADFDACVLYPAPLRDLLVQLAVSGVFRAKWTDTIHEEWIRSLLAKRPDLARTELDRTRELMNRTADSLVTGYERLIPAVDLPDFDDRHVAAAAIHAGADVIVTFNLKDFPAAAHGPYGLRAIHPDDLISGLFSIDEAEVLAAARRCRARLRNPPETAAAYLETLRAQGLPRTVVRLLPLAELI